MLTLVLLPGMDGSGALFAPFIAALGGALATRVVAYPPDQRLDYHALTEFARACLPAGAPFVLLGESFSGPVAIALAASRPPGLVGLILSCTFARNPAPFLRPFRFLLPVLPLSPPLSFLSAPLRLGRYASGALRHSLRNALASTNASILRTRLRAVLDVDYSNELSRIDVPVLYLQASHDRVVFRSSARHVASLLPIVQLVTITGPHLLLQAAPGEAQPAVTRFVETLRVPGAVAFSPEP